MVFGKPEHSSKKPSANVGGSSTGKGAGGGGGDAESVVALVDRLQSVIREVPQEYLEDVEEAVGQLFQLRRSSEGKQEEEEEEEEGRGGQGPSKRRRVGKKHGRGLHDLAALQAWMREKLPVDGTLDSEKMHYNPTGDFEGHTAANTVSVDSFLWDDDDVEELCEAGKLPRNMCLECGSRKTQPLNFVSHSLSIPELNFIFTEAVPAAGGVEGGLVVDVGSRLGCVVYAALVLGGAKESVGVEINQKLCDLQEQALSSLGADGKAKVICGDIVDQKELLGRARLTVLHNPFQFFSDVKQAQETWRKLSGMLPAGSLIIASPPLSEQLAQADGPVVEDDWVESLDVEYPMADDPDDEHADEEGKLYTSVKLYKVKKMQKTQKKK